MPDLPPMTQHDYAYFDYLEALKRHNYTQHVTGVLRNYAAAAARFEAARGFRPSTMTEAGTLIQPDLLYQFACSIQHASQVLMWQAGLDSLRPHRAALRAALEAERPSPLGRLELDPGFKLPEWYTGTDIHLTPGSYWGDELVGPLYERCVPVYRTAWRARMDFEALVTFARTAPPGEYRRILDLGCSFGASTAALRQAYPDAEEVIGIDLSAAALTWAHLRAEERGHRITFSQRHSAGTGYDPGSFDLVSGYLLLHEMPPVVVRQTVEEAFRLLRPGGHLMMLDIPPYHALPPEVAFLQDFDTRGNGEAFWGPFLSMDLPALLREAGFVGVREGPLDHPEPGFWGAAALMRTGEFDPVNRWITRGDRPAGSAPGR
jgi:SAM-dependent methyltransferase